MKREHLTTLKKQLPAITEQAATIRAIAMSERNAWYSHSENWQNSEPGRAADGRVSDLEQAASELEMAAYLIEGAIQ